MSEPDNERVVASGHLSNETYFRLAIAGKYDLPEVEKLIQLLELMATWHRDAIAAAQRNGEIEMASWGDGAPERRG